MTAVLDAISELARPSEVAGAIAALNDRLAREAEIPAAVAAAVHELASGIAFQTATARWEAVDPYLTLIIHRAMIQAEDAVRRAHEPGARDRLRVALESLRQGFAAIAESAPIADERSAKDVVRWLADTTEVPQNRLAALLGVSLRQFQRWLSTQGAQPEGDDARRARAVARIVNQLRFSLTPAGAVEWFSWPRDDLGGRRPAELLDQPERLPELAAIAGSMRSTYAT
jgi:uncharacterized protein (DUF2384 family)/stage V sporulation protein SpoVS